MSEHDDAELCDSLLRQIERYVSQHLPPAERLRLDASGVDSGDITRDLREAVGLVHAFLPGGTSLFTRYRVAELLGRVDLSVATSLLATLLALDPIVVGGTDQQREIWVSRVADGWTLAYCATEPRGGSDLSRLETAAVPVADQRGDGYLLRGEKQWITNAGVAQAWMVLARAPAGPSWFIVDGPRQGLSVGAPEDKHGIRASNTASVMLDDVWVPRAALVGEREGMGLAQAAAVFGFTRVIVGAFALGGGWAALEAAVRHSQRRKIGGVRLCDMPSFTHKLLLPQLVQLELGRAQVEAAISVHAREGRSEAFAVEGAAAKYLASEAANFAASSALQAFGGSGYSRGYMVEKICRDLRITKIYEGTSEVLEGIVGRDTWRQFRVVAATSNGQGIGDRLLESTADPLLRLGVELLGELCVGFERQGLQRNSHCILELGALAAKVRAGVALSQGCRFSTLGAEVTQAIARIAARDVVLSALDAYGRLVNGSVSAPGGPAPLAWTRVFEVQRGRFEDAELSTRALIDRFAE